MYNKIKPGKGCKGFKVLCLIAFVYLAIHFGIKLTPYPQLKELETQQYSYSFYDSNDILLQVTSLEEGLKREYTPLKDIPLEFQRTFIKAEDARFYNHNGIDLKSILAASLQNKQAGKTVRGASTISMQLAKIIDLHNPSAAKKSPFAKKIQDCWNAIRIEVKLSKKQILQLYLNNVPFGVNVEGITSAARSFYGLEINKLSLEQMCVLAVIPRSPTQNNPIRNPENAKERALDLYLKLYSNNPEMLENAEEKISKAVKQADYFSYPFEMPHYIQYLKTNLNDYSSPKRPLKLSENPYRIKTTVDFDLYTKAFNLLSKANNDARFSRIYNSALLLLDNSDGSVLAWIGNTNFYDYEQSGQIDGVLTHNQMGSSMKPFLYALALDQPENFGKLEYYPSKILADIPKEFGNETLYIPSNFNNRFNGPIRFRVALASSLNIPAVVILDDIGVPAYLNKLYDLGFDSLRENDNGIKADLGLSLGAGEVSLLELTRAFSVFPNDGVLKLNNPGKKLIQKETYSSDTARLMCSILSDKASRALGFGYSQTFETDYPSIFKTGTSNQYQNIVALGATKNFTVGVWMGNFSGETVMGKTGSSLPAYVAKHLLDYLEGGKNPSELEFDEPENWHKEKICSLSGMKASKACPASVYEYIKKDFQFNECTWHKIEENKLVTAYPEEYQSWLKNEALNVQIENNSSQLEILTPKNNAVFYFSKMNQNNQAIPVEVIGGEADTLEVYYDETFYQTVSKPFYFKLPVEKGKHSCTIVCQKDQQTLEYEVR